MLYTVEDRSAMVWLFKVSIPRAAIALVSEALLSSVCSTIAWTLMLLFPLSIFASDDDGVWKIATVVVLNVAYLYFSDFSDYLRANLRIRLIQHCCAALATAFLVQVLLGCA